jgi:hypothetical protein
MSNARYSIIPTWIIADKRLKGADLKVLCVLGSYTNKEGWCRRSQVKMAAQLECARSTVQASLERLYEIGAVAKREVVSESGRDSAHWYRVILDREVSSDAFSAWEGEEDEEFNPISNPSEASAPCRYTGTPAGIPAPPAGPESAPPAGPAPAPINDHSNFPSNEKERKGATGNGTEEENPKSIERAFKAWYRDWPTFLNDSEDAARKAWFALTADQRSACIDRTAAFVAAVKASKAGKFTYASVYLNGKAWEKLGAVLAESAAPTVHKPFSRAWSGLAISELMKPNGPVGPPPPAVQRMIDQGTADRRTEYNIRLRAQGWAAVNRLYSRATDFTGALVPEAIRTASEDFKPYRLDTEVVAAYRRFYERKNYPWPDMGKAEYICLPAIQPGSDDIDAAVEAAWDAYRTRLSGDRSNDDA